MKTAQGAFDREVMAYADGMGISLYQRFTIHEASLFLRVQQAEIEKLVKKNQISFIQVTKSEVQFFGFQLIEYLIAQTKNNQIVVENTATVASPTINRQQQEDRIIRFPEVQKMVGLSRTTIWRKQQTGEFPQSVPLGVNSVGWFKSEVERWINSRK